MYASQLPAVKVIIETFGQSIALREQIAADEAKVIIMNIHIFIVIKVIIHFKY